jgi:hypothetical protein
LNELNVLCAAVAQLGLPVTAWSRVKKLSTCPCAIIEYHGGL